MIESASLDDMTAARNTKILALMALCLVAACVVPVIVLTA